MWRAIRLYPPSRPIVRIRIIHVWDRIQIECAMAMQEVLAMLLGQMGHSILDIKGFLFAGLSSIGRRNGPFNMFRVAVRLFHG